MKSNKIFTKLNIIRVSLFVGAVVIISLFLPKTNRVEYEFSIGKPWTYSLLTAPFDIPINLDSISIHHIRDSIDANFINVYKFDRSISQAQLERLSERLRTSSLSERNRAIVSSMVRDAYQAGIVESATYENIASGKMPRIRTMRNNEVISIPTSGMYSVKSFYENIDSLYPDLSSGLREIALVDFLEPNCIIDEENSSRLLNNVYQRALAPRGLLQKGERIVDTGEIISPQTYTIISTYQEMMNERHDFNNAKYYPIVGHILMIIILLFSCYRFLSTFRWRFFDDMRKMAFLMILITLFTVFAYILSEYTHHGIFILPCAMVPILLCTFFDSRTAMYVNIVEIFLCSLVTSFSYEFCFIQLIAGLIAVTSLGELSKRSQLVKCAFFVFITYCFTYLAINIVIEGNIASVNYTVFLYFLINAIFLSFTYVLIFIVEKIFGFTSSVTLVELSDAGNPVLRELSEECPGTFQHSLQVSNLASEAARKIGANVQLVRAGALYHDIGKLANPNFFTENQIGQSPHSGLTPEQSASIVINHVTEGLRRATALKLPQVIRDFISQHHGRGKAKYFYNTACNLSENGEVDASKFEYPGPNPQTRETAILMMADAVEAASRSLKEYDDATIANLVNRIIDGQIADGMFNESPLSFRDIQTIKGVFINRLKTMYHSRIQYPELLKK